MSLAILFHYLSSQHVSDINISIIRSVRLSVEFPHWSYCSWFDVCWSFGVVGLEWYPCCRLKPASTITMMHGPININLQAEAACNTDTTPTQPQQNSNKHRTKNNTTNVAIQQNSRKLLMMDILISETC